MAITRQADYFAPLTSLRGIAALLVLVFHAAIWGFSPYFVSITSFAVKGYLWVDFFFLLSGFVIAHTYGSRFAGRIGVRAVTGYLLARFARIYPLHLVTLLFLALVAIVRATALGDLQPVTHAGLHFTFPSFVANLFLVHSLGIYAYPTWNEPSWSISSEAAVYLAFPFLFLATARCRHVPLVVASCSAALVGIYFLRDPRTLASGTIRCAAEFTIGLCLYRLYAERRIAPLWSTDRVATAVVIALVLSLHFGLFDLLIVPELCLLLIVAVANQARFKTVLCADVLQYLGRISYSVYLVHWPVFYVAALAVQWRWGGDVIVRRGGGLRIAVLLASASAIIALASLSYRYVEMPCRTWIMRRWPARAAAEVGGADHAGRAGADLATGF